MTDLRVGLRLPVFDGKAIRDAELVVYDADLGAAMVRFDDGTLLPVAYTATTLEGVVNDLTCILKHWSNYVAPR